jgi:DNA-binding MarR family transcriptional regulator
MDRLVRNELIERVADAQDRRLVRHYLSARGASAVEELERSGRARFNEVFSRLTDAQLARLVEALRDLEAAADAATVSAKVVA